MTSSKTASGVSQTFVLSPKDINEAEGSSRETIYKLPSLSGRVISLGMDSSCGITSQIRPNRKTVETIESWLRQ